MAVAPNTRPSGPRAKVDLPVTLMRAHGNPVAGRTLDLGAGGMRLHVDRPLRVDERLAFDLEVDGAEHVEGNCRVLREQAANCYAVGFEHLRPAACDRLERIVRRGAA